MHENLVGFSPKMLDRESALYRKWECFLPELGVSLVIISMIISLHLSFVPLRLLRFFLPRLLFALSSLHIFLLANSFFSFLGLAG